MKQRISVIAPVLNEIRFIKAWLTNVRRFADEIVIVDTGSTDGTWEYLLEQDRRSNDLCVTRPDSLITSRRFEWNESVVRNGLIDLCHGDWIVPLDTDEMVGDDFIQVLNSLTGSESWKMAKFIEYKFWGDLQHLRARTLRPRKINGKYYFLTNWRGMYPNKSIRLFRNISEIRYQGSIHPVPIYKNFGRLFKYSPIMSHRHPFCKSFDIGFYHYHFAYPPKEGEMRKEDRNYKVKLIEFKGVHPKEVDLIK